MRLMKPGEGKLFMISQFDSRCPACGEKIYEGDEIAKDEDLGWVHDDCYEPPLRVSKPKPAARKGPSLAERLEGNEGPTRGGIPVAGSSPAGSIVHLVEQRTVSRGENHWAVIGVYADHLKALADAFPSGVSNDNYRVKSWAVRR